MKLNLCQRTKAYQQAALDEFDLAIALGTPVPVLCGLLREAVDQAEAGLFTIVWIANRCKNIERLMTFEAFSAWPEKERPLFFHLLSSMEYRPPSNGGPCGPRERLAAELLKTPCLSRSVRAALWWRFTSESFRFPRHHAGEEGTVPVELMDHPYARTWYAPSRKKSYFNVDSSYSYYGCKTPKFSTPMEESAWNAIESDSPSGFFMPFDLLGKKVPRSFLRKAMESAAEEIVLEWLHSRRRVAAPLEPASALLAAAAYWPPAVSLHFMKRVEEETPGVIASARDPFGNDLLWETLLFIQKKRSREDSSYLLYGRSRSEYRKLVSFLMEKGCDPRRDGPLGLSWQDVFKAYRAD